MMQNSRNTYTQIKQNVFALKALFYIQQLIFKQPQGIVFIQLQVNDIIVNCQGNTDLLTKSIITRGNYILTRNYIHFKEPYQFVQENISAFNEIYSFKEIYLFKEHIFV